MGVDFHWIGTTISSGSSHNGFGKIVSFPSVPAGFPAAGTLLSTEDDYPLTVANYPSVLTVTVVHSTGTIVSPSQTGDVPVRADGSGGSYYDYTTVTDVKYKTNGTWIDETYLPSTPLYINPVYINISGTNYENGDGTLNVSKHNGSGGYFNDYTSRNYIGYGFPIVITTYEQSSTPFGMMDDGRVYAHWSDGNGSYFSSAGGWVWDSANNTGDYRSSGGYFEYGHYLGYDSSMNQTFYWNGSGGYYS